MNRIFKTAARKWMGSPARIGTLACTAFLLMSGSVAQGAESSVTVRDAWVRAPAAGQSDAGVFLRITSRRDATLVGVASPAASKAEIHAMRVVNGEMTMRAVPRLTLPAGVEVSLDHRYHLMLVGLRKPLHAGDTVPITLTTVGPAGLRQRIRVDAAVRPLNAAEPADAAPDAMEMKMERK